MVYVISDGTEYVKIGVTNDNDIENRLKSLQVGNPRVLVPEYVIQCFTLSDFEAEKRLHEHLKYSMAFHTEMQNISSEWFLRTSFIDLLKYDLKGLCAALNVKREDVSVERPKRKTMRQMETENRRLQLKIAELKKALEDTKKALEDTKKTLFETKKQKVTEQHIKRIVEQYEEHISDDWIKADQYLPPQKEQEYLVTVENTSGKRYVRIMGYGFVRRKKIGQIWDWRRDKSQLKVVSWKFLEGPDNK